MEQCVQGELPLHQHLPDAFPDNRLNHLQQDQRNVPYHEITIECDSILSNCANGDSTIITNSCHHQAVNELGKNIRVTARASDGVIEAIESTAHKFIVGVQWHNEYLLSDLDLSLLRKFITEASSGAI